MSVYFLCVPIFLPHADEVKLRNKVNFDPKKILLLSWSVYFLLYTWSIQSCTKKFRFLLAFNLTLSLTAASFCGFL